MRSIGFEEIAVEVLPQTRPVPRPVLHVIDHMKVGGAQRLLVTLAETPRALVEFSVLDLKGDYSPLTKELKSRGIGVRALNIGRFLSATGWFRLWRTLRSSPETVVHIHLSDAVVMAGPLAKLLGKKVVVSLHNIDRVPQDSFRHTVMRWLETACLKYCTDVVVAVSGEVLRSNAPRLGKVRSVVLDNVVPPPKPVGSDVRDRVRKSFEIDDGAPVIIATGRLSPQKDHINLLAAFAQVREKIPDAMLLIAGEGDLHDRLRDAAVSLGVESHVKLLGRRDDVGDLLAASDVYALSSAWEGLPLALVEAMAAGLPPVATRVGEVPRVIGEKGGLLVPPGSPVPLAEALTLLCGDAELRARMSRDTREAVQRYTDIDGWARALAKIYAGL